MEAEMSREEFRLTRAYGMIEVCRVTPDGWVFYALGLTEAEASLRARSKERRFREALALANGGGR
jgi:hypothetical protein